MTKYRWQFVFGLLVVLLVALTFRDLRLRFLRGPSPGPSVATSRSAPSLLGNSMAPTLFGAHQRTLCPHCGHINRFATESFPANLYFCGRCREELKNGRFEPWAGDAVEVESAEQLHRWDIVLVRDPSETLRIVKRLVAFPGETLQIKQGDLWIDGQRIERSLQQILDSKITLHNELASAVGVPAENDTTPPPVVGWRSLPKTAASGKASRATMQELVYTHREPWKNINNSTQTAVGPSGIVMDWYPENPAFSGSLWPVTDQILEVCFVAQPAGQLKVGLRNPRSVEPACTWPIEWSLTWNGNTLSCGPSQQALPPLDGAEICFQWTFAYCDGAYWLRARAAPLDSDAPYLEDSSNASTVMEWRRLPLELESPAEQNCLPEILWSLQYAGIERWVYRRVSRDIYYRGDTWSELRGIPMIYPVDGYFLVGDNQPISLDSRTKGGWTKGVPLPWIEGRIAGKK
jgi:hypothetical protein